MTFKDDILEAANGEPILAIVIGEFGWGYRERVPLQVSTNQVLTWEEAASSLDYKYDDGFGAPDCHAITAWTENTVIFVVQYDGSTCVQTIPRNPIDHKPEMPGG